MNRTSKDDCKGERNRSIVINERMFCIEIRIIYKQKRGGMMLSDLKTSKSKRITMLKLVD